jgi:cytochrome c peroxidase
MKLLAIIPLVAISGALGAAGCVHSKEESTQVDPASIGGQDPASLLAQALSKFGTLPEVQETSKRTVTDAKIALGRQLYFEKRLSKNQDLSCNSCHDLTQYGVDRRAPLAKTSTGHRSQTGTRNAPTVYNAARQVAQFWDGRAADVEEQAKGPILNPIEMALPNAAAAVTVLKSIPGYEPLFRSAFPGSKDAITYDNLGLAIGAFERKLVTHDRFDEYLDGDPAALTPTEQRGLYLFIDSGCPTCHSGPGLGGDEYRKLGSAVAYKTDDVGRFAVTKQEKDRNVFKVPTLRNIEKTAPYLHDGSQATLKDAIRLMVKHQTLTTRTDEEVGAIEAFLKSLTGELPTDYIKEPAALPGSASTPLPDPS